MKYSLFIIIVLANFSFADYSKHPDAKELINSLVDDHKFERSYVVRVLESATKQNKILDAMSSPAEFTVEPAGQPITIAVYAAHPSVATEQQTLYFQPHQFDANQTTFEIIVPQTPRFLVIDPQLMTIDRDLGDNQFELASGQ